MKMTLRKNGLWSECEGILAELVTAQVNQPDDVVSYQSLDNKGVFSILYMSKASSNISFCQKCRDLNI